MTPTGVTDAATQVGNGRIKELDLINCHDVGFRLNCRSKLYPIVLVCRSNYEVAADDADAGWYS